MNIIFVNKSFNKIWDVGEYLVCNKTDKNMQLHSCSGMQWCSKVYFLNGERIKFSINSHESPTICNVRFIIVQKLTDDGYLDITLRPRP